MTRLSCTLDAPAEAAAGGPLPVSFTLRNEGAEALRILSWGTPWEGAWTAPFVRVARDGVSVPYEGPMVKRGAPGPGDYFDLAPGAARTARFDLAEAFVLDRPGTHEISPAIRLAEVRRAGGAGGAARFLALDCPSATFRLR